MSPTSIGARSRFALDPERVWLNTSHQGALPLDAAKAVEEAVRWKTQPHRLATALFREVPDRLREEIGSLFGIPSPEVNLTNGSSYGLHLLANGIPLREGDEVVLMRGDFPSCILPWLAHRDRGVAVRLLEPAHHVLSADEIEQALTPRTRVVCLSWVHSFTGRRLDVESAGRSCRDNGTRLIVNATQHLGTGPASLQELPIDAFVASGWKWQCAPYGTGFLWMRESLRRELRCNLHYWLAGQSEASLAQSDLEIPPLPPEDPRKYDIFATANFFNFNPYIASLRLLRKIGLDSIASHTQDLVQRFVEGLDRKQFSLLSASDPSERSNLVVFSHRDAEKNGPLYESLLAKGIHLAFRAGRLRMSPHLYNTPQDIDRTLRAIEQFL